MNYLEQKRYADSQSLEWLINASQGQEEHPYIDRFVLHSAVGDKLEQQASFDALQAKAEGAADPQTTAVERQIEEAQRVLAEQEEPELQGGIAGVDPSVDQELAPEEMAALQSGIAGAPPVKMAQQQPQQMPQQMPQGQPNMMAAGGGLIPGYQNGGRLPGDPDSDFSSLFGAPERFSARQDATGFRDFEEEGDIPPNLLQRIGGLGLGYFTGAGSLDELREQSLFKTASNLALAGLFTGSGLGVAARFAPSLIRGAKGLAGLRSAEGIGRAVRAGAAGESALGRGASRLLGGRYNPRMGERGFTGFTGRRPRAITSGNLAGFRGAPRGIGYSALGRRVLARGSIGGLATHSLLDRISGGEFEESAVDENVINDLQDRIERALLEDVQGTGVTDTEAGAAGVADTEADQAFNQINDMIDKLENDLKTLSPSRQEYHDTLQDLSALKLARAEELKGKEDEYLEEVRGRGRSKKQLEQGRLAQVALDVGSRMGGDPREFMDEMREVSGNLRDLDRYREEEAHTLQDNIRNMDINSLRSWMQAQDLDDNVKAQIMRELAERSELGKLEMGTLRIGAEETRLGREHEAREGRLGREHEMSLLTQGGIQELERAALAVRMEAPQAFEAASQAIAQISSMVENPLLIRKLENALIGWMSGALGVETLSEDPELYTRVLESVLNQLPEGFEYSDEELDSAFQRATSGR